MIVRIVADFAGCIYNRNPNSFILFDFSAKRHDRDDKGKAEFVHLLSQNQGGHPRLQPSAHLCSMQDNSCSHGPCDPSIAGLRCLTKWL